MIDGVMVGFRWSSLFITCSLRAGDVSQCFSRLLSRIVAGFGPVMARYPESLISDWDVIDYSFWLKVEFATMPLSIGLRYYFRSFSGHFDASMALEYYLMDGTCSVGMIVVVPTTMSTSLLWSFSFT